MSRQDMSPEAGSVYSVRTSKACPMPSQTGRWKRIWVQAKIQGMARRSSMLPAALRLAGRLPMFMRPSSLTGVTAWKNSMKCGFPRTTSRYAAHDTCAQTRAVFRCRHTCRMLSRLNVALTATLVAGCHAIYGQFLVMAPALGTQMPSQLVLNVQ